MLRERIAEDERDDPLARGLRPGGLHAGKVPGEVRAEERRVVRGEEGDVVRADDLAGEPRRERGLFDGEVLAEEHADRARAVGGLDVGEALRRLPHGGADRRPLAEHERIVHSLRMGKELGDRVPARAEAAAVLRAGAPVPIDREERVLAEDRTALPARDDERAGERAERAVAFQFLHTPSAAPPGGAAPHVPISRTRSGRA